MKLIDNRNISFVMGKKQKIKSASQGQESTSQVILDTSPRICVQLVIQSTCTILLSSIYFIIRLEIRLLYFYCLLIAETIFMHC